MSVVALWPHYATLSFPHLSSLDPTYSSCYLAATTASSRALNPSQLNYSLLIWKTAKLNITLINLFSHVNNQQFQSQQFDEASTLSPGKHCDEWGNNVNWNRSESTDHKDSIAIKDVFKYRMSMWSFWYFASRWKPSNKTLPKKHDKLSTGCDIKWVQKSALNLTGSGVKNWFEVRPRFRSFCQHSLNPRGNKCRTSDPPVVKVSSDDCDELRWILFRCCSSSSVPVSFLSVFFVPGCAFGDEPKKRGF